MANNDYNNARQIHIYRTGKYLLEARDNMQLVDDGSTGSRIHHRFSKIQLEGQGYADKTKKSKAIVNIDPSKFLLLAHDVLTGQFCGFSEQKVLSHIKRADGKVAASRLDITYEEKDEKGQVKKMPWTVHLQNAWCFPKVSDIGGISMQPGTWELDKTENGIDKNVKVFFSYDDFRRFVLVVSNYIGNWEQFAFPYCMNMRKKFEKERNDQQAKGGQQTA